MNADMRLATAKAVIHCAKSLADATNLCNEISAEYAYVNGVSAWTDADVATLGITATDLNYVNSMLIEFNKFMTNQAVTTRMYRDDLYRVLRIP